jgi:4'-phosphopantetheinyl transferase EntD
VARRWLGFEDASLTFEPDTHGFTAELQTPGLVIAGEPVTRLSGRYVISDDLVVTTVVVAACPGRPPI